MKAGLFHIRNQPRLIHRSDGTGDEFVDYRRDYRENDIRSVSARGGLARLRSYLIQGVSDVERAVVLRT